ncbi:Penicillin-binding protein 1B [compost metagenome]
MRDIVRYSLYKEGNRAQLLKDDKDPRRTEYLAKFADKEGQTYLLRFWRKYRGKTTDEQLDTFLDGLKPSAVRLAAVHRYLMPEASQADFAAFLAKRLPRDKLSDKRVEQLYTSYGPGKYSLPDQGYIARVHPLELWLLSYLREFDKATFADAVAASRDERQEVYSWLFKTRHRSARDSRIRTMLEVEAFLDIHQRWARLGYPFDHLVPSLATALGSSGDRPAALAELMGIIQNGGMRAPTLRIEHLSFAKDTPFATVFEPANTQGVRVMPAEVANALRNALSKVVEGGTARRIAGAFALQDGTVLSLGGKTGTGDNRIETVGRYGNVTSSLARNRTATFVFYIGDDHFGTLTAYVPGSQSDKFRFTSALPGTGSQGDGALAGALSATGHSHPVFAGQLTAHKKRGQTGPVFVSASHRLSWLTAGLRSRRAGIGTSRDRPPAACSAPALCWRCGSAGAVSGDPARGTGTSVR